jgi:serine/alanine adding enzyme
MSIEVVRSVPADAWDLYAEKSAAANIFHTRPFIECFGASAKYVPHTFFLREDGAIVACIIAVQTRVLGSVLPGFSSRSVVYGGVSYHADATERYLKRHIGTLMKAYDTEMKTRTLFTEIRNITDPMPLVLPLTQEKYRFTPHLNYLVDLTGGEQAVWDGFSGDHRRSIKRSTKNGVTVSALADSAQIDILHRLVSRIYSEAHIPFFEKAIFADAWSRLSPLGQIRVTFAEHDGVTVAARAALLYRGRIFDWFAGSSPEGDRLNANALLVWDMIEWGSRNGYEVFDFGGAGDPNVEYGVREFKSRFQGQLVNYGRFQRVYSKTRYYLGYGVYAALRRVLF